MHLQVLGTKTDITHGIWAFAGAPGHRFIAEGFADAVREAHGDVVTNAKVREVIIQNGKATGVAAEIGGRTIEIRAPIIVCTAPPKRIFNIIPESVLPADFVRLTRKIIHSAMLTGEFGMKKPISSYLGIDANPKSFYHTSTLIHESEGLFQGNVPLDAVDFSAIAPTAAPEGKYLWGMASSFLDNEVHDRKKMETAIDRMMKFADTAFKGWRESLEWSLFTIGDSCILWKHPEDDWVDVKCPTVDGLYFAGDTYGKRLNEGGVEGAVHSAFICASAITGTDYLKLLQPVFR